MVGTLRPQQSQGLPGASHLESEQGGARPLGGFPMAPQHHHGLDHVETHTQSVSLESLGPADGEVIVDATQLTYPNFTNTNSRRSAFTSLNV